MLVLPEIQLESILSTGFAAIGATPTVLDELFTKYPAAMRTEIKNYLTSHKVSVVLDYPRTGLTAPVIAIVNAGDSEVADKDMLGDYLHTEDPDLVEGNTTEFVGLALQGNYQLLVLTQDPRLSMYLSYLVLTLLILNTDTLQEAGMHNVIMGLGALSSIDESLLPEWSNPRMVTLSCLHYHSVPITSNLINIFVTTVTPVAPASVVIT